MSIGVGENFRQPLIGQGQPYGENPPAQQKSWYARIGDFLRGFFCCIPARDQNRPHMPLNQDWFVAKIEQEEGGNNEFLRFGDFQHAFQRDAQGNIPFSGGRAVRLDEPAQTFEWKNRCGNQFKMSLNTAKESDLNAAMREHENFHFERREVEGRREAIRFNDKADMTYVMKNNQIKIPTRDGKRIATLDGDKLSWKVPGTKRTLSISLKYIESNRDLTYKMLEEERSWGL